MRDHLCSIYIVRSLPNKLKLYQLAISVVVFLSTMLDDIPSVNTPCPEEVREKKKKLKFCAPI